MHPPIAEEEYEMETLEKETRVKERRLRRLFPPSQEVSLRSSPFHSPWFTSDDSSEYETVRARLNKLLVDRFGHRKESLALVSAAMEAVTRDRGLGLADVQSLLERTPSDASSAEIVELLRDGRNDARS